MKRTKVYIDTFYYISALSGLKTYIEELVYGIKIYGSKDIEYVFSHDIDKLKNKQLFINSKFRLIRWIFHFRYLMWKQIVLPLKLIFKNIDYIICPDYVAPILCSSKKIIVVHDNFFWKYYKNYSLLWRSYYTLTIKLGVSPNSLVVTTSNYSKKNLESIFKKNKIVSIYQSSDIPVSYFKNMNKKKYILHVGTFERRKDLLTLVKAFHKLKNELNINYKLVLAGSKFFNGNNKVYKELENYILNNDLIDSIILPGYVSKEKVLYYYSNAFIYVFPSIDEGFGIPIIEALNFSIPIICSDIPIFKELGGDSVLYFKRKNYMDLFEKMKFLIENNHEYSKLKLKGLNQKNIFNRKKFVEEFEKLY